MVRGMRAVLLLFLASPAAAQDLDVRADLVALCAEPVCIGAEAEICMAGDGGTTTVGMGACLSAEADLWDARLNAAYGPLRDAYRRTDVENEMAGWAAPSRADALRDMQRAWIAYRDATCALAAAQFGGGTGRGPAHAACRLEETARQALELEALLDEAGR